MSYYRSGIATEAMLPLASQRERVSLFVDGAKTAWRGMALGQPSPKLYRTGIDPVVGAEKDSGPMATLVSFLIKIAHILLILIGMRALVMAL